MMFLKATILAIFSQGDGHLMNCAVRRQILLSIRLMSCAMLCEMLNLSEISRNEFWFAIYDRKMLVFISGGTSWHLVIPAVIWDGCGVLNIEVGLTSNGVGRGRHPSWVGDWHTVRSWWQLQISWRVLWISLKKREKMYINKFYIWYIFHTFFHTSSSPFLLSPQIILQKWISITLKIKIALCVNL